MPRPAIAKTAQTQPYGQAYKNEENEVRKTQQSHVHAEMGGHMINRPVVFGSQRHRLRIPVLTRALQSPPGREFRVSAEKLPGRMPPLAGVSKLLVDAKGFEPSTSALRTPRSPN